MIIGTMSEPIYGERDPTTPLTQRGLRTRERLLHAAMVCFPKFGYTATNATVIATEARLSHSSFYVYFPSKEAIFEEVLQRVIGILSEEIRPADQVKNLDFLARLDFENRRYFDLYARFAPQLQFFEEVARTDTNVMETLTQMRRRYAGELASVLKRMQARADLDPKIDSVALAYVLSGMTERVAYYVASDPTLDREALIDAVNRQWLVALGKVPPD